MLLRRGVDINARDTNDQTPLHKAATKGNVNVACLLIERGAEVDSRDKWRCTPLHRSSRYGRRRGLAGSSRSQRRRERKAAEALDSDAFLNMRWIPRDDETVT